MRKSFLRFVNILLIVILFVLLIGNVMAMKLLSPIEDQYVSLSSDRLRLRLDYDSETMDETWVEINDKKIDVREDLVTYYKNNGTEKIQMTSKSNTIKNVSNYMEYKFNILMTGSGSSTINLTNENEISPISIRYDFSNRKGNWKCYSNNKYVTLTPAKNDYNYNIKISAYNSGVKYTNYTVSINGVEKICFINQEVKQINKIIKKVDSTSAIIKDQYLNAGTYYIDVGPGKHKVSLFGKIDEDVKVISNEFNVILNGCGDLVCENKDTYKNCPVDCKEFSCADRAFLGDTNNDNEVNDKDLKTVLNIMDGRLPKPKRDCCIDLNDDGEITLTDYNKIEDIKKGDVSYTRCDTRCKDGTNDGMCSITAPFYCDYGELKSRCSECGCNEGYSCMADETCFKLEQCKCSDVASNPKDSLGYDNIIDIYDQYVVEDNNGTCGVNNKFDLNSDGCVDKRDLKCIEYNFGKTTTCSGEAHCNDGTSPGTCTKEKPNYCSEITLEIIEDCRICGCIPYDECGLKGQCERIKNFEVIIISNNTNLTKQYMQGGTIFTPVIQGDPLNITFSINPLKDLENVTVKINLKEGNKSLKGIDDINNQFSKPLNLTKNQIKDIVLSVKGQNNQEIGIYYGEILILINEYEFSKIPLEVELKNKITEEMLKNNESNWEKIKKRWPYIISILFVLGVLIFLIRKRNKEREYIKSLERKHNLILR